MRARFLALLALAAAGCGDPPCNADGFKNIRSCVFQKSCNFSSCHSAAASNGHANQLDLETSPYEELLAEPIDAVAADKRHWVPPPDWRRVTPGDEMRSFLWIKLTMPTTKHPEWGDRMPDTNQTLNDDTLLQILAWIRAGAPNN